jgi:hypothetical protein
MPVTVRKSGDEWLIVEIATGKIVGRSDSKRKASIAASIRNKAHRGELDKKKLEEDIIFFSENGFSAEKAVNLAFFSEKSC